MTKIKVKTETIHEIDLTDPKFYRNTGIRSFIRLYEWCSEAHKDEVVLIDSYASIVIGSPYINGDIITHFKEISKAEYYEAAAEAMDLISANMERGTK